MANIWGQLDLIWAEITITDAARYSGMTNAAIANDLNSNMVAAPDRSSVPASEVLEVLLGNTAEFEAVYAAMTEREKRTLEVILATGTVEAAPGSATRSFIQAKFNNTDAPTILAALAGLLSDTQSRAAELGITGRVAEAHVFGAREKNGDPNPSDPMP